MPSHAAVIINATSGAGDKEEVRARIMDFFKSREMHARILFARDGTEIETLARRAVEEDCCPIIAGGGDGTINAVATHVVGTRRTLGVLPLGTLNHFARDIQIPLELDDALRVCLEG